MKPRALNTKAIIPKRYKVTPPNMFSPFNIEYMKNHTKPQIIAKDIIRKIDDDVAGSSMNHHITDARDLIEILHQLMAINIFHYFPVEQVAPKTFVIGLTLLKTALDFAKEVAATNLCMSDIDNLKLAELKIKELIEGLPISWEDLSAYSYIVRDKDLQ